MEDEIRTYAELQDQMHDALRKQHPEWIEANGECSACQVYENRFAEQLEQLSKSRQLDLQTQVRQNPQPNRR
jgi:hypothetical protein